jgi:hypothetical protein
VNTVSFLLRNARRSEQCENEKPKCELLAPVKGSSILGLVGLREASHQHEKVETIVELGWV